jgi:hypothetical protein
MFIEYLSKSPLWKESAVFIIEDDAQNGSDHVDAHRTTAYVAGGFVKRGFVDHTPYSTSSMLRTIGIDPGFATYVAVRCSSRTDVEMLLLQQRTFLLSLHYRQY